MRKRHCPPALRHIACVVTALWFAVCGQAAQGQTPAGSPRAPEAVRAEARQRFDRGIALFEEGDAAGALAEFKRTNDLMPNPLVLFNMGMVYAAMNRPVDATDTLKQVIAAPGALSPAQLEQALRTHDEQTRRVARLRVASSVPAVVEIDGIAAGRTPMTEPLRVAAGAHVVGFLASGHLPLRKEVTLAGGSEEALDVTLEPSETALAHLVVRSPVPGADVVIDGQKVGQTPLPASLTVKPGTRVIELTRPGYLPARREISLGEGASGDLAIGLEIDAALRDSFESLTLDIRDAQGPLTDVVIAVDGQDRGTYLEPLRLPAGVHTVRLDRKGYEPSIRQMLPSRAGAAVQVTLVPTSETRLLRAQQARSRRTAGWISVVAGAAVTAGGAAVAIVNAGWLTDSRKSLAATAATFEPTGVCFIGGAGDHPACKAAYARQAKIVDDQELRRNLGFVAVGVGLAAVITGSVLLHSNPDPDDAPTEGSPLARVIPAGFALAGGGGLMWQGTF